MAVDDSVLSGGLIFDDDEGGVWKGGSRESILKEAEDVSKALNGDSRISVSEIKWLVLGVAVRRIVF